MRVVLLAGTGVGKSRLAREALAEAEHDGAVAMWVQATRSAASVPLGAFAGVIPAEVRSDDRFELLRGSTAVLSELAGERPLMIGVDDAQLLDPVSAALVLHVATAGHGFILATVRTGEPCPDAIVSLWKDAGRSGSSSPNSMSRRRADWPRASWEAPWRRACTDGSGTRARATRSTRGSWCSARSAPGR